MGLFKQMKDMKNVVAAAPDMIEQAQALQAQSQELAAAQQQAAAAAAAAAGATGTTVPGTLDAATLAPIAGITIEVYAKLSKRIGTEGLDDTGVANMVVGQGYSKEAWDEAYTGWNDRFKGNTALAVHFGTIYSQA